MRLQLEVRPLLEGDLYRRNYGKLAITSVEYGVKPYSRATSISSSAGLDFEPSQAESSRDESGAVLPWIFHFQFKFIFVFALLFLRITVSINALWEKLVCTESDLHCMTFSYKYQLSWQRTQKFVGLDT